MAVVESYNELSDPGERRQVLSITADILPFKRLRVSSGLPRERVDSSKVDHF